LHEVLDLRPPKHAVQGHFMHLSCTCLVINMNSHSKFTVIGIDLSYILLPPHHTDNLNAALFNGVCAMLATQFDVPLSTVRPRLDKAQISTWGKVRCLDSDTIHASSSMTMGDDRRDASYVRVSGFDSP
jgi:hypothetical protein